MRAAREAKGLSLIDAERGTRIRQKYLVALEDDTPAALPGPTYARGFVRNYASYLEIDVDEALYLYDTQSQPTRDRIKAARGEPATRTPARRDQDKINIQPLSNERIDTRVRYGSQYIALSLLAIPLLIVFYFIYSAYAGPQSQPPPTPPVSVQPPTVTSGPVGNVTTVAGDPNGGAFNTPTVLVPPTPIISPQQTVTSTTVAGVITGTNPTTATAAIPAASAVTLRVVISGHESWMSVRINDVQQFAGTLPIGTSREWEASSSIQLRVGRADAVRVYINGADRGFMGTPDNLIVEKKWDKAGNEEVIQP